MENNNEDQTLFADGFDKAIVGVDLVSSPPRIIYDKSKMIDVLVHQEELSIEDAIDFLAYNVWGAYVGLGTPIYMDDGDSEHIREIIESYEL